MTNSGDQVKGEESGSDICECGDFRSQHTEGGPCRVCGGMSGGYNGCKEFRFAHVAQELEKMAFEARAKGEPQPDPCKTCGHEREDHQSGFAEFRVVRKRLASLPPEAPEGAKVTPISEFTFAEFQSMNIERCRKAFPMCDDWSLNDWAVALAGEVGELCNLLKKDRRKLASDERYILDGEYHELARANVLSELADVMTYADLMMSQLSADTAEEVLGKFNEVSRRVGYGEGVCDCARADILWDLEGG